MAPLEPISGSMKPYKVGTATGFGKVIRCRIWDYNSIKYPVYVSEIEFERNRDSLARRTSMVDFPSFSELFVKKFRHFFMVSHKNFKWIVLKAPSDNFNFPKTVNTYALSSFWKQTGLMGFDWSISKDSAITWWNHAILSQKYDLSQVFARRSRDLFKILTEKTIKT